MYGFTTTLSGTSFDQALANTLLLPCNVIVREEASERVVVGFLDPQIMVNLVCKPEAKTVGDAAQSDCAAPAQASAAARHRPPDARCVSCSHSRIQPQPV